jgi:hypothetical protein
MAQGLFHCTDGQPTLCQGTATLTLLLSQMAAAA